MSNTPTIPRHREGFTPRHRDENRSEDVFTRSGVEAWLFVAPRHLSTLPPAA
jgi:hypothetical protein